MSGCCLDCLNFKMKKKWKAAYCQEGIIAFGEGSKDRLFQMENSSGVSLNKRGRRLLTLNRKCHLFNDMGGEE